MCFSAPYTPKLNCPSLTVPSGCRDRAVGGFENWPKEDSRPWYMTKAQWKKTSSSWIASRNIGDRTLFDPKPELAST